MRNFIAKSKKNDGFGECANCKREFPTQESVEEAKSAGEITTNIEGDGYTYEHVYYHKCGDFVPNISNIVETDGFDY